MRKTTYCQLDTMKDGVNFQQGITLRLEEKLKIPNFPSIFFKTDRKRISTPTKHLYLV